MITSHVCHYIMSSQSRNLVWDVHPSKKRKVDALLMMPSHTDVFLQTARITGRGCQRCRQRRGTGKLSGLTGNVRRYAKHVCFPKECHLDSLGLPRTLSVRERRDGAALSNHGLSKRYGRRNANC